MKYAITVRIDDKVWNEAAKIAHASGCSLEAWCKSAILKGIVSALDQQAKAIAARSRTKKPARATRCVPNKK